MRKISTLVVHCTATPEGKDYSVDTIRGWHKQLGWADIGYHAVVHLDGSISEGRPEAQIGAHVAGYNKDSLGVVYVGGLDSKGRAKDTRTQAQKIALREFAKRKVKQYGITKICGHRDFPKVAKACPCFDAIPEYADLVRS